jgi:hypothetical protein
MLNMILSLALLGATPQEHQLEAVLSPKEVSVVGDDNITLHRPRRETLKPVEGADRKVTLIVPSDLEGQKKLVTVLKTNQNVKELIDDKNKTFHLYEVPFADLKDAATLRDLAKKNEAVQMYPTFKNSPYKVSGVVLINLKVVKRKALGENKDKFEAFVKEHNLVSTELLPDRFALQITDKSDILDVWALLETLHTKDWVQRVTLDYSFSVR